MVYNTLTIRTMILETKCFFFFVNKLHLQLRKMERNILTNVHRALLIIFCYIITV
jgi:hypothetical protein